MAINLKDTMNRVFGKTSTDDSNKKYQSKITDLLGSGQNQTQSNAVGSTQNKTMYDAFNPFTDSSGNSKNPYIDYQAIADSNASEAVKNWAKQAGNLSTTRSKLSSDRSKSSESDTTSTSSGEGQKLVESAEKYLGTDYVWGGESPDGFDCSGLMQYVAAENGISIPRTTYEQVNAGTAVESQDELQPGDLVFFGSSDSPHHVGMYIGNGQYLHAPKTGDVVKISDLSSRSDYAGARRITQ